MSFIRARALLHAAAGLVGLVLALVLVLTFIDWNRFRGPVERTASARFGREVRIAGPLQVRVWSRTPTVTISGLTIGNPAWDQSAESRCDPLKCSARAARRRRSPTAGR